MKKDLLYERISWHMAVLSQALQTERENAHKYDWKCTQIYYKVCTEKISQEFGFLCDFSQGQLSIKRWAHFNKKNDQA